MTLSFVLGTAAELIKVYPLIEKARTRGATIRVVMSGQSRENFQMQYRDFNLPMSELFEPLRGSDLVTARAALWWFVRALFLRRPPLEGSVVVHGDTLTSLLGAIWGRRLGLRVAHVEAGLRSPKLTDPFPEEINRRLVSKLARLHFAPDQKAADNLRRARVKGEIVATGGNTLIDAVQMCFSENRNALATPYVLSNIHRFENLNSPERLDVIATTLTRVAKENHLIFVSHPQTKFKLANEPRLKSLTENPDIEFRERMPFRAFIKLLSGARYLVSDGGSNQEECSYLGKPCLLLRENSERQEGLGSCCVLSRFDGTIIDEFLRSPERLRSSPLRPDVSPSEKILDHLLATDFSV